MNLGPWREPPLAKGGGTRRTVQSELSRKCSPQIECPLKITADVLESCYLAKNNCGYASVVEDYLLKITADVWISCYLAKNNCGYASVVTC